MTARGPYSLSRLFRVERAGVRDVGKLSSLSMWLPLTPTFSPLAGKGRVGGEAGP